MIITGYRTVVVGTPWRELAIIEVHTDEGLTGLGEVRMVNKTDTLLAAIDELAPRYLIGTDPFDVARLAWQIEVGEYGLPGEVGASALAAFDIACWDIMGKALGQPIWRLLGGAFRDEVPAYANGWYQGDRDPAIVADLAQQVTARGYGAVKIDPFGAASSTLTPAGHRLSTEILQAVRDAIGPDRQIYVEMHGRFTGATAAVIAHDIAGIRPGWLEEPTLPLDIGGLRQVRASTPFPIALGERIHHAGELRGFLEQNLVDIVQVDVTHHGGITGFMRLVGWTNAYNVLLAPHNVCGPIGTAAALHCCIAAPNVLVLEHFNDFADVWVHDIVDNPPRVSPAGTFAKPTAPGLGLSLVDEVVAAHPRTGGRLALYREGWERRQDVSAYAR
ncbi:MAG: mandelate racemase/muconate lactonizing enzyme family protein [Actinomycetales bacterium]|nr:mandelate racemase/muconate lactonizing enzyme family protein [Actinomycetales bacterium]